MDSGHKGVVNVNLAPKFSVIFVFIAVMKKETDGLMVCRAAFPDLDLLIFSASQLLLGYLTSKSS